MKSIIAFLPFVGLLLILYIARLVRQQKAKNILRKNTDKIKMYIDNGKTIDDGIIVKMLNGQKPLVGRDSNGSYVILNVGDNTLSVSFRALKDFAAGIAIGTVTGVMPIKELNADISCFVEPNIVYKLEFNQSIRNFEVKSLSSN